jgi:hypothetical protein
MWADDSLKAIVFQVLECHGWSGLANARKLSNAHNHVWAKAGGTGASSIPGDYRIEITAAAADQESADQINDVSVLSDTIDCGNATPSIVGHNLPALFRLAFPRSIEPQGSFEDGVLGSREFQVGDAIGTTAMLSCLYSSLCCPVCGSTHRHTIRATDRVSNRECAPS